MKIRKPLFLLFAFLCTAVAFAQDKGEPPQPTRNSDDPPFGLPLPIDDYIFLLIPVGLALGIYIFGYREKVIDELPEDV